MILTKLYASATALRNRLYDNHVLPVRKLRWPVISVGNISAGGSGKTPFVILLGQLLSERGIWVDVLSRGYRRSTRGVLEVQTSGTAAEFGDEPLLIARKLRQPVIVGVDRFAAGSLAETRFAGASSNPTHLLDDGFQHRRLHRDFNIVLLNEEDLQDRLLPEGRLREPLTSLARADAVVVCEKFPADALRVKCPVWRARRIMDVPALDLPVIAFCGIARPERFFAGLRERGLNVVEQVAFRDHHRYAHADIERLLASRKRFPGAALVTTEKDEINLGSAAQQLGAIAVPIRIELLDADSAVRYILGNLRT